MLSPFAACAVFLTCAQGGEVGRASNEPVGFNRDVRPILADRCFRCHGPDAAARKRGLRLDLEADSRAVLKSGRRAIVPGDLESSELARRILSDDPDEVMPPPEIHRPLDQRERGVLLDWIRAGARYEPHWAFVAPRKHAAPAVRDPAWCRSDIDRFILARLESEGLHPAGEADRPTLLRRLSIVLTGIPPTPEETAAFDADTSPEAYERQVDRLLASPRFGERMAADWLDAARFADTFGYQSDWECRVWPWRDWLLRAFNENLSYDRFLRDQLAGDLEPGATRDQILATSFNRLHRQTNEGGSIDEEFRQEYVSDRVHTFGTAFLGMTLECARCHDHKFDPITQSNYYSLCAFFGDIDEAGTYPYSTGATPRPAMRLATPDQEAELARRLERVRAAEAEHARVIAADGDACRGWLASHPKVVIVPPVKNFPLDGGAEGPTGSATLLDGDTGPKFEGVPGFRRCDPYSLAFHMKTPDIKARATLIHTSRFTIETDAQGYQVMLKDGRLAWEVVHFWPGSAAAIRTTEQFPVNRWVHVAVTYDGSSRAAGLRIYLDGEPAATDIVRDHLDGPATVRAFEVGFRDRDLGFKGGAIDDISVFDRELSAMEVAELASPGALALALSGSDATPEILEYHARVIDPACAASAAALREARAACQELLESIPEIMVMDHAESAPETFVLRRGRYDDPDRERPVRADSVIDAILPFERGWAHNRLGLAAWATDARQPLVARVEINRLWAMCFGRGIVGTQENFGMQGESPTHPELLDTLSAEFVEGGWNVKGALRRIVCSATFRQSSVPAAGAAEKDPRNLLLSRGPSFRLSAEAMRDQALFASGLLVESLGGPSVKPWQPPGLWEDAGANAQGNGGYVPDTGPNAHRRSIYTYRKRTAPPPNMLAFDSGSREQCLARRLATNTPLQPLVVLNDPVFVECARALAARAAAEAGPTPAERVQRAFRLLVARAPRENEMRPLLALYTSQFEAYSADTPSAAALTGTDSPDPSLAALTIVCSTIMASDAAIVCR